MKTLKVTIKLDPVNDGAVFAENRFKKKKEGALIIGTNGDYRIADAVEANSILERLSEVEHGEYLGNSNYIALFNGDKVINFETGKCFIGSAIIFVLQMILKCGYHAPSGHNMQSWRFTVLTKSEDIQRLKELSAKAAAEHKVHFYGFENPKVLVLVSNDTRNPDGCQDASCAAENMMLAASSYGIGSVWLNPLMTLRNVPPLKELLDGFGVPAGHTIWAAVALGYPVSEGVTLQKNADVVRFV